MTQLYSIIFVFSFHNKKNKLIYRYLFSIGIYQAIWTATIRSFIGECVNPKWNGKYSMQ